MDQCLCRKYGKKIFPYSSVRTCLRKSCSDKYFYASSPDIVSYYLDVFYDMLEHKRHHSYKFKKKIVQTKEYQKAWLIFIRDIYYSRSFNGIATISFYYSQGIGVKKNMNVSNALLGYAGTVFMEGEIEDPCPVCITNSIDYGILCSECGNLVCEYCYFQFTGEKLCPCCRTSYVLPFQEKFDNLVKLMERHRNKPKSDLVKFHLALHLNYKNRSSKNISRILLVELVSRGYDRALPILSNLIKSNDLLQLGIERKERSCLEYAARKLHHGTKRGTDLYIMAASRGDYNSLYALQQQK